MFLKFRHGLVVGALLCALGVAPAAEAKTYSMDITCAQLADLAGNSNSLQTAATLFYWLPGWWAAAHNDPYINDWRRSLLTEAVLNTCSSNKNARILNVVRNVKTLPKVPDNALKISCKDFLYSNSQWQAMNVFWLQGYYAFKDGHTDFNSDYDAVHGAITAMCKKNPTATSAEAARKVLKK